MHRTLFIYVPHGSAVKRERENEAFRFELLCPASIWPLKETSALELRRCCTEVDNRLWRVELPGPRQAGQTSDMMLLPSFVTKDILHRLHHMLNA